MICFSEKELLNFFRYNDYLKGTYLSGIKSLLRPLNVSNFMGVPVYVPVLRIKSEKMFRFLCAVRDLGIDEIIVQNKNLDFLDP